MSLFMESLQVADDYRIDVLLDKDKKTLTIKNNGIGVNAAEIRRYIKQIAFPSAEEFFSRNLRTWNTKTRLLATLASVFTQPYGCKEGEYTLTQLSGGLCRCTLDM